MYFLTHYRRLYYVCYSSLEYPTVQGLLKIIKRIIKQNSFVFESYLSSKVSVSTKLMSRQTTSFTGYTWTSREYLQHWKLHDDISVPHNIWYLWSFDLCVSTTEEMPNYWKHEILGTSVESDCVHLSHIKYIFLGSTWHLNMRNGHLYILSSLWTQL